MPEAQEPQRLYRTEAVRSHSTPLQPSTSSFEPEIPAWTRYGLRVLTTIGAVLVVCALLVRIATPHQVDAQFVWTSGMAGTLHLASDDVLPSVGTPLQFLPDAAASGAIEAIVDEVALGADAPPGTPLPSAALLHVRVVGADTRRQSDATQPVRGTVRFHTRSRSLLAQLSTWRNPR